MERMMTALDAAAIAALKVAGKVAATPANRPVCITSRRDRERDSFVTVVSFQIL
jgi:hypothetical protein